MTASVRRRGGLKPLAAALFPISLVLALLALEEPAAVAAWSRASQAAAGAWSAARGGWDGLTARLPAPARNETTAPLLQGVFAAADARTREATGDLDFHHAELRFASAGVLKTRPGRIAVGGEAAASDGTTFARLHGGDPNDQIELRQVLAGSNAALCAGAAPGWIGLRQAGAEVTLAAFRAGPAPGPTASPEAPCAVLTYRR